MKVKDIVSVVDETQELSIDVIIQDDVDDSTETYVMNWTGSAKDVPLYIRATDIVSMSVDQDCDCCSRDCFHIVSEE
jgi:hypothetical protein